jgi:TolB-like protein
MLERPMTAFNSRVRTLGMIAMLFLASPCFSQEFRRLDIAVQPFEAAGQADPEFAAILTRQLTQAIERNSDFRVVPGSKVFYLRGQLLVDEKRHLLTLRLFDAKLDRMLWLQNYDFEKVSVGEMADDLIEELYEATRSNRW